MDSGDASCHGNTLPGTSERAATPVADLCRTHASWLTDQTGGVVVPPGWVGLVAVCLASIAAEIAHSSPLRLTLHAVVEVQGRLFIDLRPTDTRSRPSLHLDAIERMVEQAALTSASTCRFCGGPAHRRAFRVEWALCDHHTDAYVPLAVTARPGVADFPLYDIDDVAAALGERPSLDFADSREDGTGHQAALRAILEAGEGARWRSLSVPGKVDPADLDDLDRRAPHMHGVLGLVRRHLLAAEATGQPTWFPPLMLVGEPGMGKTWFLSRLAQVLRVPFRHYPMNLCSLGEGLSGAHASWRNAQAGLVARTLLSEPTANPLILIDEADKPPLLGREDPYRALYTLLEPEGASSFVDEYLTFPLNASAVLWLLAGNSTDALPPPILDRVTVIRLPAMDEGQLRAVVASVYRDANAARGGFFEPDPPEGAVCRLLSANVRGIRRAVSDAMVNAAADGRRSILPDDVVVPEAPDRRIGFMRGGRP